MKDTKLIKEFKKICTEGYEQGWHERNGGNLSYRMNEKEVEELKEYFNEGAEWKNIGTEVKGLANEYFMVTGSGKYMKNVNDEFEDAVCILKVSEDGTKYKIVYGLVNGGRPTSELPTHLMNLEVLKHRDKDIRIVYHCHPVNTIALTFVLPLEDEIFTREIWEMMTECPIIFPNGIGVIPWMVPGGREIGVKTSEIMKEKDIAIWAHHGMFVCGKNFDETFGLMYTVEKAAEILVKVLSMSKEKLNTIKPQDFRALQEPYNISLDEKFLYEKKSKKIGEK